MPEGTPPRPPASAELAHLLRMMSIRSEVIEQPELEPEPPPVDEPTPAVDDPLDQWVEAKVQQQEEVLAAAAEEPAPAEPVEEFVADEPLTEPDAIVVTETTTIERDEPAPADATPPQMAEGDQLSSSEAEPELEEGRGEDFQALLGNAAPAEPEQEDEDQLLPADGEVRLLVRAGPRVGSEFTGRCTLAGATGIHCLVDNFVLPVGTMVRLTLIASQTKDELDIPNAVVRRIRKAPQNSIEVQLGFTEPRADVQDFVTRHFGEKPNRFSLLDRLRTKH